MRATPAALLETGEVKSAADTGMAGVISRKFMWKYLYRVFKGDI
jgi:hypothetical protein